MVVENFIKRFPLRRNAQKSKIKLSILFRLEELALTISGNKQR